MTAADGNGQRPKVLIPEKVSPDGLRLLQASLEVHERKGLTPEDLLKLIPDYDALIVRSETKVTAELLAAGKKLRVVARAGVGVDNVDLNAATKLYVLQQLMTAGQETWADHSTLQRHHRRKQSAGQYQCRSRTHHSSSDGCRA